MADQNNKDEELENQEPEDEEESEDEESEDEFEEETEEEEVEEEISDPQHPDFGKARHAKGSRSAKRKPAKKTAKAKAAAKAQPLPGVDLNAKVDDLQKLTDKNTVISIAGYSFTPAKLMIVGTLVSSLMGGLYASFEVYKDYMDMKQKIAKYVAPDLSEFDKRLTVVAENSEKSVEYTQDIKNDLKGDIRRLEGVVDAVERDSKVAQRDIDKSVQEARRDVRETKQEVDKITRNLEKDTAQQNKEIQRSVDVAIRELRRENEAEVKKLRKDMEDKIQKALDNPLANR